MRILITGASGLLGKTLLNNLKKEHEVFALVRSLESIPELGKKYKIVQDLNSFDTSVLPKNLDVIYYLAQSRKFRDFPEGALDVLEVNVHVPVLLADWGIKNGVKKFFYTSTGGVYTDPNIPVCELFDIIANKTQGFYFNSKLSAELLLKNYAEEFESFSILRPFFIYGPGQNEDMLIPRLVSRVLSGDAIYLEGGSGLEINPIFVDDAAIAFAKLLQLSGNHIINIAGSEVLSLRDICYIIGKVLRKDPLFEQKGLESSRLIADISEMKSKLHIPNIIFRDGVLKLIKAMKL